jgi:two-component system nitrate/nitrite response regulator NarL
MSLDPLHQT